MMFVNADSHNRVMDRLGGFLGPLLIERRERIYGEQGTVAYIVAALPSKAYAKDGSIEFTKRLLQHAKVSVSPGIGFGEFGDGHVRFAMIENEARTRQAIRGIKQMFRDDGLSQAA